MAKSTEVSFSTTVEIEDLAGQPEEITVHVRVVKSVSEGRELQIVSLKDSQTGGMIDLESLSGPEKQELLDRIGLEFQARVRKDC